MWRTAQQNEVKKRVPQSPEAGFTPATPESSPEHEFFDEGSADGDAENEEEWDLGGLAHSNHGVVGSIHPNIRSDEAEEKSAGEGRRSPDGPMPPSGASVTKVFPARPTGANFTDEPAGRGRRRRWWRRR